MLCDLGYAIQQNDMTGPLNRSECEYQQNNNRNTFAQPLPLSSPYHKTKIADNYADWSLITEQQVISAESLFVDKRKT